MKSNSNNNNNNKSKCQMGDGLIIICHLCKAETQPRGVGGGGTGRRVGNRLQIVSLARFGCVLTCGGGGQGKARQGKARRICLLKQKAIKTTPSGSERRRAERRELSAGGEQCEKESGQR